MIKAALNLYLDTIPMKQTRSLAQRFCQTSTRHFAYSSFWEHLFGGCLYRDKHWR